MSRVLRGCVHATLRTRDVAHAAPPLPCPASHLVAHVARTRHGGALQSGARARAIPHARAPRCLQAAQFCSADHSLPQYYAMHTSQLWPGPQPEQGPPREDDPYYCLLQWQQARAYPVLDHPTAIDGYLIYDYADPCDNGGSDFDCLDNHAETWRGIDTYSACPYWTDRHIPETAQRSDGIHHAVPGDMFRPLNFFGEWSQACPKDRAAVACAHELRQAWQDGARGNSITHDGLGVDPACTKTSRTAHHYDGTGMSVGITPGTLAEAQPFTFTMYIGARETAAAAEAVAAALPGVKFWATAWAGAAADDGGPATFFYAFDVPTGAHAAWRLYHMRFHAALCTCSQASTRCDVRGLFWRLARLNAG